MLYVNHTNRTEMLRQLKEGESTLLAPYSKTSYASESTSIKAIGTRLKTTFTLKKVLIVVEGEVSYPMIRVTHAGHNKK